MNHQSLLYHAAKRANARPLFVAFALAQYQQTHQISDGELATWLEMKSENLPLLALCHRPISEQEIQQIADYAGCNAEQLAQVLWF